jgi:protein gp37
MAEQTAIEWCDSTFNPVVGCTKVSPACDGCYAEAWAKRTGHPELWNGSRRLTSNANWHKVTGWNARAGAFRATHGRRRRVFCASLADVFDNQWEEEWRAMLWFLIQQCPGLDFLLLTKRPQNIRKMLPDDWGSGYPNVWLGATTENQEELDRRLGHLLAIPAKVHFLSCEPLLGPLDLSDFVDDLPSTKKWVITGGGTGGAYPLSEPAWFRDIGVQCVAAGIPWFHKQMTRKAPIPPNLRVRQFPELT